MHALEFYIPLVIAKVNFIRILLPFLCSTVFLIAIEDHVTMSRVKRALFHFFFVTLVSK